eukprot:c28499_g1_i1.p1 GENE.c28499_g1_i1~~c28499_g1_i1.p1  ORF type:complete len:259 (-),score=87.94 c28499_g1_i1:114-890(-)
MDFGMDDKPIIHPSVVHIIWKTFFGSLILHLILQVFFTFHKKTFFGQNPYVSAYYLVMLVDVIFLSFEGIRVWFGEAQNLQPYDWNESAMVIGAFHAGMEFYNFLVMILDPKLHDVTMLSHHVVAGISACLALRPFMLKSTVFYAGVAELSTIPLTIADFFKVVPGLKEKYPAVLQYSRLSFGIIFLVVRVFGWGYCSWESEFQLFYLFWNGNAPNVPVIIFLFVAVALGQILQTYWGILVIKGLLRFATKKHTDKVE